MHELPLPESSPLEQAYRAGLRAGVLRFPSCECGHRWLPASPECPACLHADHWQWAAASGDAHVVSWVVYHTAYHPAFKDRLPYNVAIVGLAEGPRLISNIVAPLDAIRIGLPLRLRIEDEHGIPVARFEPAR